QGGQLIGLSGNMKVSNLIVNHPGRENAATPLEAGVQLDASYGKQVADIRQCLLSLTPTSKATNQLQLTGHVDMSETGAITANLDSGSAKVTPFKLFLNGAPVTASVDADVSVPGYKYNFVLNAQKVPLAPLVNSFQPERKGQVSGTAIAEANISGIGTTGENLQKNLKGNFNFN